MATTAAATATATAASLSSHQVGQRLIEHGYVARVSRELKAQQVRHFANTERTKNEFRGGDSLYRFDTLRISPFQVRLPLSPD